MEQLSRGQLLGEGQVCDMIAATGLNESQNTCRIEIRCGLSVAIETVDPRFISRNKSALWGIVDKK